MLAEAGATPSKHRGQNFLVQTAIANRIVALLRPEANDRVVEIGPGLGILTERLLTYPIAGPTLIELDHRLAAQLRERFAGVEVIEGDFLKLDPGRLFGDGPVKVIGNLPFNVATAMLHRLGEFRTCIATMVLMFQREVAARLRATPGSPDYGALTVLTAMDWELHDHFRVQAGSFYPPPKVDAEVLRFLPAAQAQLGVAAQTVRAVVRASFSSRRKSLRNSLAGGLGIAPAAAAAALTEAGIEPSQRAEKLTLQDFIALARAVAAIETRRVGRDA